MANNITHSNLELAKRIHKSACVVSSQEELLTKKIDDTKSEIIGAIEEIDTTVTNLENKILDLDVSIGEGFVTNMEVGGIEKNTTINSTDQLKKLLKNMLLKLLYAEVIEIPSCTISPATISKEIGTKITPEFKLTYKDGKFISYLDNGNTVEEKLAGCEHDKSDEYFTIKDGGSWQTYTNKDEIIVKDSTISVKGYCSYNSSTVIPKNSDGTTITKNNKPYLSIDSGECVSGECQITGKYGLFFTALEKEPETVGRSTFGSPHSLFTTGIKSFEFNNKVIYLAIPSGYKLEEAISEANEDQAPNSTTEIEIEDAGGTKRPYVLYTFKYSATGGLGLPVNCNIKKA
jgi:hypothetical protein